VLHKPHKPDDVNEAEAKSCSVWEELLASFERFFDLIETARTSHSSDWLTVDEVAGELKISKSIVYRLIRNGELEAVDLGVSEDGDIRQKGHYRIKRSALDWYLEAKKVKPPFKQPTRQAPTRRFPKVKNHLGL